MLLMLADETALWAVDRTPYARRARQALVDGHQPGGNRLGECDIRRVVTGQIVAQLPDAGTQQLVWPNLDPQVKKIGMCLRRLIAADCPTELMTAQDIGSFVVQQRRRE